MLNKKDSKHAKSNFASNGHSVLQSEELENDSNCIISLAYALKLEENEKLRNNAAEMQISEYVSIDTMQ